MTHLKTLKDMLLIGVLGFTVIVPMRAEPYRQHVQVSTSDVRLSDVVDRAPGSPDPLILHRLTPGQKLQISPDQVAQVASQQGVEITFDPPHQWIHVERACDFLTSSHIKDFLDQQGHWDPHTTLCTLDQKDLHIPIPLEGTRLILKELLREAPAQRFIAYLSYHVDDIPYSLKITGRLSSSMRIPVLKQTLAPGETILPHHVGEMNYPQDQLNTHIIQNPQQLIGHAAARPLHPDQPLRLMDVKRQILVKKGQMIQAKLSRGGLSLSVKAKALEEGAIGDTIKALNVDSKKEIYGVIRDTHTMEVS